MENAMNGMTGGTAVIVKKRGFFSGLFGLLTAMVVCGTGLGAYGIHLVDHRADDILKGGQQLLASLREWRDLPPMLAQSMDDSRDPAYLPQVATVAKLAQQNRTPVVVFEVRNTGAKAITYLSARILVEDSGGVPHDEIVTRLASPLALCEDELEGPILPGQTRKFVRAISDFAPGMTANVEISDIRTWNGTRTEELTKAAPEPHKAVQ
jgi:hypothetical protein